MIPGEEFDGSELYQEREPVDDYEESAVDALARFFDEHRERVFFSRQIELFHEDRFFHWVTNRALHRIIGGSVQSDEVKLRSGTTIRLLWNKSLRYYRREAKNLVTLVNEYSDPNVGASLGLNAELLALDGFARKHFLVVGRHANSYGDKQWTDTKRDFDFILEKDSVAYGVEVKNQLRYPEYDEFQHKIRICQFLGVRPVFVVRMMPKVWVHELNQAGGFGLILKYQLYPLSHKVIAERVAEELGLPVRSPRALRDSTMERFVKWHKRNVRIFQKSTKPIS